MSTDAVIAMTESLYAHWEREAVALPPQIPDFDGSLRPIACARGCNHCCKLEVGGTAAEILAIKRYAETQARGSLEKIKTRVRHQRRAIGDKRGADRERMGLTCPLLGDDGQCLVYPVRPLGCRGIVSCDAEKCREDAENPRTGVRVPYSAAMRGMARDLSVQLHEAQKANFGLAGGMFELVRALSLVWTEPDSEARLLRGEDVLAPARVPV